MDRVYGTRFSRKLFSILPLLNRFRDSTGNIHGTYRVVRTRIQERPRYSSECSTGSASGVKNDGKSTPRVDTRVSQLTVLGTIREHERKTNRPSTSVGKFVISSLPPP